MQKLIFILYLLLITIYTTYNKKKCNWVTYFLNNILHKLYFNTNIFFVQFYSFCYIYKMFCNKLCVL